MNQEQLKYKQFEILEKILPNFPEIWSQQQVIQWLNQIGMNIYEKQFQEMKIDGLIILDLTQEDLENELQITKKLHLKKIIKALNILKEYTIYLQNKNSNSSQKNEIFQEQDQDKLTTVNENETSKIQRDSIISNFKEPKINFFIKPIECDNQKELKFYDNEQIKIGCGNDCQLQIMDEQIEQNHVRIKFKNNKTQIQDLGSINGTYIKLNHKQKVQIGEIYEIGSFQYLIKDINNIQYNDFIIELLIIERNQFIKLKNEDILGRNLIQSLIQENDPHLSLKHCFFTLQNNQVYIEDLNSTNGSWFRISPIQIQSQPLFLKSGNIFRIGYNFFYEFYQEHQIEHNINDGKCIQCQINDKNSLILPCKHNSLCYECGQNIKHCPVCLISVNDVIKMYLG